VHTLGPRDAATTAVANVGVMLVGVVDAGTSTLRVSLVDASLRIAASASAPFPTHRSGSGEATFDANALAATARALLEDLAATCVPDVIAITSQRASAVLFDPPSRRALAPGIGWEDARTAARCLELARQGVAVSPSESATKFELLLAAVDLPHTARVGTIDAWLVCALTEEGEPSTDPTNAAVTGLTDDAASSWSPARLTPLRLDPHRLVPIAPTRGLRGHVRLRGNDVPLTVVIGDQQAAHAGHRATTKLTLGTSAVADHALASPRPVVERRGTHGCFPVPLIDVDRPLQFGLEAFWPAAGSVVAWLSELGILATPSDAAASAEAASGAVPLVVPAFAGAGAPVWDFGARGIIRGITGSTGPAELVRGVLEGLAHVGTALLDALARDTLEAGHDAEMPVVGVDGQAGHNPVVAALLATLLARPVELSSSPEATTIGAARLALGLARTALRHGRQLTPGSLLPVYDHAAWLAALNDAREALPALSAVRF